MSENIAAQVLAAEPQATPAAAPVEPVETTEAKPKVDESMSAKFAALARKEKAIHEQRKAYKSQEELSKQFEELQGKYSRLTKAMEEGDYAVLKEHKLAYDKLTRKVIEELEPTDPEYIRAKKEEKFQTELEELKRTIAEKEAKEAQEKNERVKLGFKKEIEAYADANKEKLKFVDRYVALSNKFSESSMDKTDLIYSIVEENYNQNKTVLTVEEASERLEKWAQSAYDLLKSEIAKDLEESVPPKQEETNNHEDMFASILKEKPKSQPSMTLTNASQTVQQVPTQKMPETLQEWEDFKKSVFYQYDYVK